MQRRIEGKGREGKGRNDIDRCMTRVLGIEKRPIFAVDEIVASCPDLLTNKCLRSSEADGAGIGISEPSSCRRSVRDQRPLAFHYF